MTRAAAALVAAAALAAPARARGHEVLHEVARDRAVAVRAYFADGEVLAYDPYEVYSPADATLPHQKGRTDRQGWLAFVPDAPGKWRVKVTDASGHGLDLEIDASAAGRSGADAPGSALAFALRPVAGLAAIGLVFGALFALYRRKAGGPPT